MPIPSAHLYSLVETAKANGQGNRMKPSILI